MKKSLIYAVVAILLVIVTAPFVFAAPEAAKAAPAGTVDYTKAIIVGMLFVRGRFSNSFWHNWNRHWVWAMV